MPKVNHAQNHPIGILSEKSLHAALKEWDAKPGDRLEENVDGFHIDIVRHDLLIEIQTANFSSLKRKLATLTERHRVRLVFPIALEKWIVRMGGDGMTLLGRRKSPKRGHIYHLFEELISIPELIKERNFSVAVLLIQEEEIRRDDGQGSWRRKGWSIVDHRLIEVVNRQVFNTPSDFLALIPNGLPERFSTIDLAEGINQPRWLAQKIAYCLRNMGAIEVMGKKGNLLLYSVASPVLG